MVRRFTCEGYGFRILFAKIWKGPIKEGKFKKAPNICQYYGIVYSNLVKRFVEYCGILKKLSSPPDDYNPESVKDFFRWALLDDQYGAYKLAATKRDLEEHGEEISTFFRNKFAKKIENLDNLVYK